MASTEKSYANGLKLTVEMFIGPFRAACATPQQLVAPDEISTIFGNLEALLRISKIFLSQLEDRVSSWSNTSCIADILQEIFPFLKIYRAYHENYHKSLNAIKRLRATNPKFLAYVKMCRKKPECGGLDMASYLITPIQRVPRYQLLVEGLVRSTPKDHPDYEGIKDVESQIQQIAVHIEDSKSEQIQKLVSIQVSFGPDCENLIEPWRYLVKEGQAKTVDRHGVKTQDIELFLLSDAIVYSGTSKKGNKREYRGKTLLADVWIRDMPDSPWQKNIFQVIHPGKYIYTISAKSSAEKVSWMDEISECADKLIEANSQLQNQRIEFLLETYQSFLEESIAVIIEKALTNKKAEDLDDQGLKFIKAKIPEIEAVPVKSTKNRIKGRISSVYIQKRCSVNPAAQSLTLNLSKSSDLSRSSSGAFTKTLITTPTGKPDESGGEIVYGHVSPMSMIKISSGAQTLTKAQQKDLQQKKSDRSDPLRSSVRISPRLKSPETPRAFTQVMCQSISPQEKSPLLTPDEVALHVVPVADPEENAGERVLKEECQKKKLDQIADSYFVPSGITEQEEETESEIVVKQGYLIKRGKIVKNWKQRWCVLYFDRLSYFKDENATEARKTLLLKDAKVERDSSTKELFFDVVSPKRRLSILASTRAELSEWMMTIRSQIELARQEELSNDVPTKKGFLLKLGQVRKNWKTRWFVLKGMTLFYFKDQKQDGKNPLGHLPLEGATIDIVDGDVSCFRISTKSRSMFVSADSAATMMQWIDAINTTLESVLKLRSIALS
eukprot:TRINITY_DN5620_c0_g1_i1.p1 TRINITY_DN5620_c0_g1~~TRINITY_DN5620_c0_g1_i1.p1  ORF type:complete len:781 (-),score=218.40 TRINITY_DN5620_c0_g1_i1:47-2389(-)